MGETADDNFFWTNGKTLMTLMRIRVRNTGGVNSCRIIACFVLQFLSDGIPQGSDLFWQMITPLESLMHVVRRP